MRIGVDIDGVISDSYPAWLQQLNRHFGKNITVIEDYEMHLVFDVPHEDMSDFFVHNMEQVFMQPKPVAGARAGIEELIAAGHEIIYVTARTPEEEEITLRWLTKHEIPHEQVLFTGLKSKLSLVESWGMDVFIEDYMVNASEIASIGVPVFLLNTSYNQGKLPAGVVRCDDWADILEGIYGLDERDTRASVRG